MKYCEHCGSALEQGQKFCSNCGAPLQGDLPPVPKLYEDEAPKADNMDLMLRLVGEKKADYYRTKFEKLQSGSPITWNWPAFLFSAGWMLYRKMYLPAIILIVVNSILVELGVALGTIISIALGLFGNLLYMKHLEKTIEKADTLEGDAREAFLNKRSGVAKWVAVVYGILVGIVVIYFLIFVVAVTGMAMA